MRNFAILHGRNPPKVRWGGITYDSVVVFSVNDDDLSRFDIFMLLTLWYVLLVGQAHHLCEMHLLRCAAADSMLKRWNRQREFSEDARGHMLLLR